jgi:glycerol-1-phosphate dehydrogenase [NAD(P)+]
MGNLIKKFIKFYLNKPVIFSNQSIKPWLKEIKEVSSLTIVTSNSPLAYVKSIANIDKIRVILSPTLERNELDKLIPTIETDWIVGIGGGRIMDVSKYLALKANKKLCMIPSIMSTTSWINFGIALRLDNVMAMSGDKRASKIIVDPALIKTGPKHLSVGGVADLLCSCTALTDWKLSSESTGEKYSETSVAKFKDFIEDTISHPERLIPFSEEVIYNIYQIFLESISLCGASFTGRPLEGSEHFLYYFLDQIDDRTFNHGSMIAFTTILSLKLQKTQEIISPERLMEFYDAIGVKYTLSENNLTQDDIKKLVEGIQEFIVKTKLPYSILNTKDLFTGENTLENILKWIKN